MPLRKEKVSILFSQGVHTEVDHKILPKEALTVFENGRFDKIGALNKRTGYALIDKESSDLVVHKDALISRNVITGNRITSGTLNSGKVYSAGSGEFVGDVGYSDGIDYTSISVSKGSEYRQEDSNVAISADGKYACVTFVDVSWDKANNKKQYTKRASIIDRETNSVIASDLKIGHQPYSGNQGRRMRPIWIGKVSKFLIFGDDELCLKVWMINPSAATIQVTNASGVVSTKGTDLATSTYPLASHGTTYAISGASFDVTTSSANDGILVFAVFHDGAYLQVGNFRYDIDAPTTWPSASWAQNITSLTGHVACHRTLSTGTHANKVAFAFQDGNNLNIYSASESSTIDTVTLGIGTTVARGVFRDSINPLYTDDQDVQYIFEFGAGAMGSAGQYQLLFADSIHSDADVSLSNFKYLSFKQRLAFALGRGPVSMGVYHDDNPTLAEFSEPPVSTISFWETDTTDDAVRYSSRVSGNANQATNMFNGAITVGVGTISTHPGTMTVSFDPPIEFASQLKFYHSAITGGEWALNGGSFASLTSTSAAWEIHSAAGTLSQLQFKGTSGGITIWVIAVDTVFLVDTILPPWKRDHLPVGTFLPEWMPDIMQSDSYSGATTALKGEAVAIPVGHAFERHGTSGDIVLNSTVRLFDFRRYNEERADVPAPSTATLHDILYVADNGLFQYDGEKFHIPNFSDRPAVGIELAAGGTNLDYSSLYFYKVVYEWVDAQGNLHQSEPSEAVSETTESVGNKRKMTIRIADLDIGNYGNMPGVGKSYREDVKAAIYRTSGGGIIYNNITTVRLGSRQNTDGYVEFVDDIDDDVAATGKFLYTGAGELSNTAPPASARYVVTHRGRLFVIGKDDVVYFSKLAIDGYGIGFNPALGIRTPDNISDPPTALGSMDGNLFIFTSKSIYIVSGEGPDNTGIGGFYDTKKVPSAIGAIKGSPVKLTNEGLLFVSRTGIYLLGRNMAITNIGSPVQDLLTGYTVRDIIVDDNQESIFFLLSGGSTNTKVLSYNYDYKQWGIDDFDDTDDAGTGSSMVRSGDSIYIGLKDNDGAPRTYKEQAIYKDSDSYIEMKFKTGWINLSGIQSYQRVYAFHLLGESKDSHTLTVNVYYDYDTTSSTGYTYTTTSTADGKLQIRGHLTKQKCQSIQFEVWDQNAGPGTGFDGFTITEIGLELGVKQDNYKDGNAKLGSAVTIGSD